MRKIAVSLFIIIVINGSSMAQVNIDSLKQMWYDEAIPDTSRLDAMNKMIWDGYLYSQPDSAFHYAQEMHDFAEVRDLKKFMGYALNIQGISYRIRGDYPKALEYYIRCLSIREELDDKKRVAGSLNNIGLIYTNLDQYPKALDYYQKSLKIYEAIEDQLGAANVLNNIGIIYVNNKNKTKALEYFERSLNIYQVSGDKKGIADCMTNIGNTYKDIGVFQKSLEYYRKSLPMYELIGDKKGIADCLINMGHVSKSQGDHAAALRHYQNSMDIYNKLGDKNGVVNCLNGIGNIYINERLFSKAVKECEKALELAREMGTIAIQKDACTCLYDAHKALGQATRALYYHELMQVLYDSLQTEETTKQMERMEFQKQMVSDSLKQEKEKLKLKLENEQHLAKESKKRNVAIAGGGFFILLAAGLYNRMRYMRKSNAVVERERQRSENLLLNILPAEIAQELKEKGRADARDYDKVTILFTDFREFTQTAEKLSAQDLVKEINHCFEAFDNICARYGVEKIKTIGDAYMAAGGLPIPSPDSVKNTVLAALDMQVFISERRREMDLQAMPSFEMRIGIHTGPVVAGIVGVKKFQYDIWGDAVNTASRIESAGETGKVNISHATYELIKNDPQFTFDMRGKINAKGKGALEMYFVGRAS